MFVDSSVLDKLCYNCYSVARMIESFSIVGKSDTSKKELEDGLQLAKRNEPTMQIITGTLFISIVL